ncbi:NADP-dependent oxidoreductase [Corallococcus sicarius]|uniref:NADP-dependent oxidoreductase n=1 Tax=Corallococcus sicarius TaxID=2316726 RepID=A0A3A8NBL8_9BACT|nr:NADP-dependent oxidoreductase [Corallococcus sicarius]RKH41668.1 NADP-dependent oxidoreductase [Corallococcus sicarius]
MKAITFSEYGGPEVLHVTPLPEPVPGPGQVRIRVRVAGVNPVDAKLRSGLMSKQIPLSLPAIPGSDVAGTVDAVGEGVTALSVGDEVFGWADTGSYAEAALATKVVRKPQGLSWDVAVALPVAGEAATRGLRLLNVQRGETLLIHGGSGAVGTLAVQLALQAGATVIATASPAHHDSLRAMGALPVSHGPGLVDQVKALGLEPRPDAPHGIDAVFDVAGKGALPDSITLRGSTRRILTIADPQAFSLGIPFSAGTPKDRSSDDLEALAGLATSGKLDVAIAAHFPLEEAARAQALIMEGHPRGKIILVVNG